MFTLGYEHSTHVECDGKRYRMRTAWDNVLRAVLALSDVELEKDQRGAIAAELLVGSRVCKQSQQHILAVVKAVFNEFSLNTKKSRDNSPRVMDWRQDSALIYAAFMQTYQIDLSKLRGYKLFTRRPRLDWRDFTAMLSGLPDNTRFKEIVEIRARKIPEATKYNAKEIAQLYELKARYAISVPQEEAEESFQADLDKVGDKLEAMAKM